MKTFHRAAISLSLCASSLAAIADEIKVLGVSLDQPLKAPLSVCPWDSERAKSMCWVGKPFVSKDGSRLGHVHLPNPDSRPGWAAHGMFEIQMTKAMEITKLSVKTVVPVDKHKIAQSISSRYGLPVETDLPRLNPSGAKWKTNEGSAKLFCFPDDRCEVSFTSPKGVIAMNAQVSAREAIEAKRPVKP